MGWKCFFVSLLYFLAVIQTVSTEAVWYVHVYRLCVHRLIPLIRVCCLLKRCRAGGTGARTKEIREHRQTANFSVVSHTTLLSHFVSFHTHTHTLSRLWLRRPACVFFIKHLNIYKSDLRPYSVSKGFSKRPWPSTANRSHTLSWEQGGRMMVRAGLPECGPRFESPAWKASGVIKSPLNNSSDTTGGHIKWLLIKDQDCHPLERRHKSETANEGAPDGEKKRSEKNRSCCLCF